MVLFIFSLLALEHIVAGKTYTIALDEIRFPVDINIFTVTIPSDATLKDGIYTIFCCDMEVGSVIVKNGTPEKAVSNSPLVRLLVALLTEHDPYPRP